MTTKKILVIGPAWVGDMIMAQCLFKRLRSQYPDAQIDVVGPKWAPALLERMPEVDRAVVADIAHGELGLGKRLRLAKELRQAGYNQSIAMSRGIKAALIPWFARIPVRTGYKSSEPRFGIVNDQRRKDAKNLKLKAQQYAALALPKDTMTSQALDIIYPSLKVDKAGQKETLNKLGLSLERPVVALAPGAAYGAIKRWPAEYFSQLTERLIGAGYQVWIFGNQADSDISQQVVSTNTDFCIDLCGKTGLSDVVDLLALAKAVVGNDTGLAHIASAVTDHVVVLYGPTHPNYAPPLCSQAVCLWGGQPGETLKNAPVAQDGHALSMYKIPVDDVLQAVLGSGSPSTLYQI